MEHSQTESPRMESEAMPDRLTPRARPLGAALLLSAWIAAMPASLYGEEPPGAGGPHAGPPATRTPGALAPDMPQGAPSRVPPGTLVQRGMLPPWKPSATAPEARRAWCRAVTRAPGLTDDAVASARWSVAWQETHGGLGHPRGAPAHEVWATVVEALEVGTPLYLAARLEAGEACLAVGDAKAARAHVRALQSVSRQPPAGLHPATTRRWDTVLGELAVREPLLVGALHEAEGRFDEAGRVLEATARDTSRRPQQRVRVWRRSARAYARAGFPHAAERAGLAAVEAAPSPAARVEGRLWLAHLRHQALDDSGRPRIGGTWPGTSFRLEVEDALRDLGPGCTARALEVGSFAVGCGQPGDALALYELALDNPHLREDITREPALVRGLLVAVPAAIEAKQFARALAYLQRITREVDEPTSAVRALLTHLEVEVRDAWSHHTPRGEERQEPSPSGTPEDEPPSRSEGRAGGDPERASSPGQDPGPPPQHREGARGRSTGLWLSLLLALVGAGALGFGVRFVNGRLASARRRRR